MRDCAAYSTILFFALCIIAIMAGPAGALDWSDDFDDGDFTSDPTWIEDNHDDHPGIVEVAGAEDYVRFYRDVPYGNGGGIELVHALNLGITDETAVKFDVNPVYSDVGDGAGWHNGEYPIEVRLHLRNAAGDELQLAFCYNYRGGASLTQSDFIRVAFPYCQQNVWLRNEEFTIRDYFPQAETITRITLAARGWDFEGYADNVRILDAVPSTTQTVYFYVDGVLKAELESSSPPSSRPIKLFGRSYGSDRSGLYDNVVVKANGGTVVCDDSFETIDTSYWGSYGSPTPYLVTDFGNGPPCLCTAGDSSYDSGLYSLEQYDWTDGYLLQADFYMRPGDGGLELGIADDDGPGPDGLGHIIGVHWKNIHNVIHCVTDIAALDVALPSYNKWHTITVSSEPVEFEDDFIDFVGDAVYVWGCVSELIFNRGNLDPDQRQWFIDQCLRWGVKTVYLSVGDTGSGDDVRLDRQAWMLTDTNWNGRSELAALIRAAGKADPPIAIHAMIGASCSTTPATAGYYRVDHWIDDWDNSPSHFRESLDALLEWNSDPEHTDAKFAGLHLDIEEPRQWDYLDRYATILGEIKDQAWDDGMALSVDTEPHWFSPDNNPDGARAVIREGDVDYVVVMAYADSREAIWQMAENTVNEAGSCGKDAVIAVATHEFWDGDQTKPDHTDTFFEEGRSFMAQELDRLEGDYPSIGGFAYHAWNNSVALSDIVAAVTVPKNARVGHVARFDVDLRKPDQYDRRALLRLEIDAPPIDGVYSFVEDRVVTMRSPWTKNGHVYWDAPTEPGTYGVRITAMDYDFNTDDNEFYGARPEPIPLEEWEGTLTVGGRAGDKEDSEMYLEGLAEAADPEHRSLGFFLAPSRPCPARGEATIEYGLPEDAAVSIEVYDIRGRLVQMLVSGPVPEGMHSTRWAADVPSGVYFCRMTASGLESDRGFSETIKILFLK
ncbi:MAG: hypothetical protein JXE06_06575 [Coriobacteriia bacterium]|nr:hypothetical protein [Coriobacteriia bacterium]